MTLTWSWPTASPNTLLSLATSLNSRADLPFPQKLFAVRVTSPTSTTADFIAVQSLASNTIAANDLIQRTAMESAHTTAARVPFVLHDNGTREERPDLAVAEVAPPPAQPITILREGKLRGQRIAILAFSPVYQDQTSGELKLATHIQASLNGTQLLSEEDMLRIMDAPYVDMHSDTIPLATMPSSAPVWKIVVAQRGMQRITSSALAAVGVPLMALNPNRLKVFHDQTEIALELIGLEDGNFDAHDEVRFYSATPDGTDRWNSTDAYWLVIDTPSAQPGLRISTRDYSNLTTLFAEKSTAWQRGVWRNNSLYDATIAGADGDHWFATQLSPANRQQAATLATNLPLATGRVTLTLAGSTFTKGQHQLSVSMGAIPASININAVETEESRDGDDASTGASRGTKADNPTSINNPANTTASFSGVGNWQHSFTSAQNDEHVVVDLSSAMDNDNYLLDSITFTRPVQLNFGGQGGEFWGARGEGARSYRLAQLPPMAAAYDITDATQPTRLEFDAFNRIHVAAASTHQSQHFFVAGPGTMLEPVLETVSDLANEIERLAGVEQIYIVPNILRTTLQPLINHRVAQKRVVLAVAAESVYNSYSAGKISPKALRQFFRYAVKQNSALKAVTLVGDGSSDPLNFLGKNNPTLIPPYLAEVDPWLGETACDTCFVQLDGEDPHDDWLPDLMIGRLPVKTPQELAALVNKIIAYETAPVGAWSWRSSHLADNYQDANGVPDGAGNFPVYEDTAVSQQPAGIDVQRVYFDPYPPTQRTAPWREPNPIKVHAKTLELFNAGAAIINFQGHGEVDRLAFTANTPNSSVNYLLHSNDIAKLKNGHKLPLVIQMACLTGAFHRPIAGAATIDEHLVLAPNGGAIATWGATGWGVAYQHDFLQAGVYAKLWATPQMDATLGQLTQGGFIRMSIEAECCWDSMRTYALLGDPLTVVRAMIPQRNLIPLMIRTK